MMDPDNSRYGSMDVLFVLTLCGFHLVRILVWLRLRLG